MPDFGYSGGAGRLSGNNGAAAVHGSANVKTGWSQLVASTPFDASGFHLLLRPGDSSINTHFSYLVDIGVGAAGSESVIVADIAHHYYSTVSGGAAVYARMHMPASIPAGSRIAMRSQVSNTTAVVMGADLHLDAAPLARPEVRGVIATMGAVSAASTGTELTAPSSGEGVWTEIVASTSRAFKKLGIAVGGSHNANVFATNIDIGFGAAGSEVAIVSDFRFRFLAGQGGWTPKGIAWVDIDIPAGARLTARSAFIAGTANNPRVILYGAS